MKNLWQDSSRKKEKNQINKIINEKGEVTTDNAEIKRIKRDYYEQLYGNKTDNLEEMDKLLEMYNLPRLNQEEIENMNRPTTSNETQSVIKKKKFQQTKVQDQVASTGEFCQTFVEELTQIFLKPCQKIAEEGTLLILPILRGQHHPDSNTKDITKKENHRPVSLMN